MSEGRSDGRLSDPSHRDGGPAAPRAAADWLSLSAAPAFAIMALLTAAHGAGPADILCAAARGASPLGGMVPMYILMTAVHAGPWIRLATRRRRVAGPRKLIRGAGWS